MNEGNKSWYYITSPADAFDVIAVGSVDRNGIISGFSSRGPSADGRGGIVLENGEGGRVGLPRGHHLAQR